MKRIAIEPFLTPVDGNSMLGRFRRALGAKLQNPFYIGQVHLFAERDSNANRWIVFRFRVRDSRVSVESDEC